MIIHNEEKESSINKLSIFFMNYVAKCDLTSYFNINISNNIVEDYKKFDKIYKPKSDGDYAGVTILPHKRKGKIQILISENSCTPDIILHELTHMYDFVLFSHCFCNDRLYKIMKHKYYQTFIFWSEFHVKQIDIPYTILFLDKYNNIPEEKWLLDFKSNIKDYYYPRFTEKFINKKNPQIRDIMWYLGEIFVCNLYDENNSYTIPDDIAENYCYDIKLLYEIFADYSNFLDFASNIKIFYKFFR